MNKSESISKLAPAILKAQKAMGNAVKDSKNPFFKSSYADLNAVREACIPALNENGVSVLQTTTFKDGKSFVQTTLLHESGEFISTDTEILCAKQNDPQAYGSGISYARRYGLQALVCLGSTDDDGEAAMGRAPQKTWNKPAEVKTTPAAKVETVQAAPVAPETLPEATEKAAKPAKLNKPSFKKTKATPEATTVDNNGASELANDGWNN